MATINSLAEEYANYLRLNVGNPSAASEIVRRINALTYTSSGKSLSESDKDSLLSAIEEQLQPKRTGSDGRFITESEDSTQLIRLIQMVRSGTEGK